MEYLVLVGVAMISFFIGRLSVKKSLSQGRGAPQDVPEETKKTLSSRSEERKEKIIQFIRDTVEDQIQLEECGGMLTKKGITRVDIVDSLNVSDPTARRYLSILEEEDMIAQISGTGRDARYILKIH